MAVESEEEQKYGKRWIKIMFRHRIYYNKLNRPTDQTAGPFCTAVGLLTVSDRCGDQIKGVCRLYPSAWLCIAIDFICVMPAGFTDYRTRIQYLTVAVSLLRIIVVIFLRRLHNVATPIKLHVFFVYISAWLTASDCEMNNAMKPRLTPTLFTKR